MNPFLGASTGIFYLWCILEMKPFLQSRIESDTNSSARRLAAVQVREGVREVLRGMVYTWITMRLARLLVVASALSAGFLGLTSRARADDICSTTLDQVAVMRNGDLRLVGPGLYRITEGESVAVCNLQDPEQAERCRAWQSLAMAASLASRRVKLRLTGETPNLCTQGGADGVAYLSLLAN